MVKQNPAASTEAPAPEVEPDVEPVHPTIARLTAQRDAIHKLDLQIAAASGKVTVSAVMADLTASNPAGTYDAKAWAQMVKPENPLLTKPGPDTFAAAQAIRALLGSYESAMATYARTVVESRTTDAGDLTAMKEKRNTAAERYNRRLITAREDHEDEPETYPAVPDTLTEVGGLTRHGRTRNGNGGNKPKNEPGHSYIVNAGTADATEYTTFGKGVYYACGTSLDMTMDDRYAIVRPILKAAGVDPMAPDATDWTIQVPRSGKLVTFQHIGPVVGAPATDATPTA